MPYGDSEWIRRNPDRFEAVGSDRERLCECGATILRDGMFFALQDHPWRPPRIECDCGRVHQLAGLRCRVDERKGE